VIRSVKKLSVLFFCFLSLLPLWAQDDASIQQHYGEAQRALAQGNYPEAEQKLEQLAKIDPAVAEIHANLGIVYFQEKKFAEAIPELRRALQLKPILTDSELFLAMSLSELGRYKEAIPGLVKGFHSSRADMKRMCGLQLERAYSGLNENSKAVEVALEMSKLYPNDPEVLFHNGTIFGNYAFLSMQTLFRVAPDSVWSHQAAASTYESQGAYESAIGEYRQVLSIDPRRAGIHYRLGRTFLARSRSTNSAEDRKAAANEFHEELKLDPLNASSAYELGEMDRSAGDLEGAQKYFELALKNYPDFEEAHLGIAGVLASEGKSDAALLHLQKAISLDPENEVSWYRLALAERSTGKTEEAQKALAKFHQLHNQKPVGQTEAGNPALASPEEVTKQTLDTNADQQ